MSIINLRQLRSDPLQHVLFPIMRKYRIILKTSHSATQSDTIIYPAYQFVTHYNVAFLDLDRQQFTLRDRIIKQKRYIR